MMMDVLLRTEQKEAHVAAGIAFMYGMIPMEVSARPWKDTVERIPGLLGMFRDVYVSWSRLEKCSCLYMDIRTFILVRI